MKLKGDATTVKWYTARLQSNFRYLDEEERSQRQGKWRGLEKCATKWYRARLQSFKYLVEEERNWNNGSERGYKGCTPKAVVQKDKVAK